MNDQDRKTLCKNLESISNDLKKGRDLDTVIMKIDQLKWLIWERQI